MVCAAQAASAASADAARRRAARFKRVEEWHVKAQKAYEKETNQRVLALKSHNYEEYLRLARSAKDDRLRALMDKTDEIMTQLGKKVSQRAPGGGPAVKGAGAEEQRVESTPQHWSTLVNTAQEYVRVWPGMPGRAQQSLSACRSVYGRGVAGQVRDIVICSGLLHQR